MSESAAQYYYPNKMGRIVLQAIEEILGRNELIAVLDHSGQSYLIKDHPLEGADSRFSFHCISAIFSALEEIYGLQGGQGIAIRSGRVCFKHGLREFGSDIGLTDVAFRLLPPHLKTRQMAAVLANAFNQHSDQSVRLEETEAHYLWIIDRCPVCWERRTHAPTCHAMVGLLQEALYWVSSGKYFNVKESSCIAQGDASCTIQINKEPLE